MGRPIFLAAGPLDRAAHVRREAERVAALLAHPNTRIVPVWQEKTLVAGPREVPRARYLGPSEAAACLARAEHLILLGFLGDHAYFAADLGAVEDPRADLDLAAAGAFVDLRTVGSLVPADEASVLAYARAMVWWHRRTRFCSVCGAATEARDAGFRRVCTNPDCAAEHHPRSDPAAIVLVHDGGERCLLGRAPRFPAGMVSTLAGFVEPGESVEDCVIREVREEAGISVTDPLYRGSQPWPFPQSLMLGYFARALTFDLKLDPEELSEARWVTREELRATLAAPPGRPGPHGFWVPPGISIARRLIEDWVDGI